MSALVRGPSVSPARRNRRSSVSPHPRRGRHRDVGGHELRVERAIKEVGGSAKYLAHTRTNYGTGACS
uniref:Uncharacterized protein n=1 Tax=Arundo donax TaxID=35708 RepID=A0A0A9A803_ARUDO